MADNDTNTETAPAAPAPAKSGGKGKFLLLLVLLLAAAAGGGAGYKFFVLDPAAMASGAIEPPKPDPVYVELRPAFVVNLADIEVLRFVQAEIDLMSRDPDVALLIEQHMPAIRHQLVLTLSMQNFADLLAPGGKDALLEAIRARINTLLAEFSEQEEAIEEVYFSAFVMQ